MDGLRFGVVKAWLALHAHHLTTSTFNNRQQPATIHAVQNFNGTDPPVCAVAPVYPGNTGSSEYSQVDLTYSYVDASGHNNGNVASITNNLVSGRSQNFTYDSLNRLATAQTTATHTSGAANCWAETYSYDPWGNLYQFGANTTTQSAYIGCSQESGLSTSSSAPSLLKNQLAGYTYDAAGNLINDGLGHAYTYNAENQLVSAAGIAYTYDGDGKRATKSNGTVYWYDLDGNVIQDGTYGYFYMNGQRLARRIGNEVDFFLTDHLGSTRYIFSTSGSGASSSDFYPFGGERVTTVGGSPSNFKFTGKERDSESGLDNFGTRYNSSSMGRFMSPDWSTKPQGVPYAVLDDPQSLNLYAYVRNNPLNKTDPSGHYICNGTQAQCQAIADGLAQARAALKSDNLTKEQRAALNKVVGFFGKAGDEHDGVTISFGKTQSPRAVATAHSYKDDNGLLKTDITFNSSRFRSLDTTQVAGTLVHERSHGLDGIARGNMDPQTKNQEFRTELRAYGVESYVPKALNVLYPGLWNPNWAPDSAEASRFTGVFSGAIASTSDWCSRSGAPGC